MALESNSNEVLLGNDTSEDDFAALDSMAFTGTQSQFGMNTVAMTNSSGGSFGSNQSASQHSGIGGGGGGMGDGRDNGFSGVSGSLFDRIRARTAEQQKQSLASQSSQLSSSSQPPAQSSSQQSAFMSQQQTSSEPTMELENNTANNAFDAAVANSGGASTNQSNDNNNNETTYSFSASAGEDFSQATPNVPVYGASRDDPYYAATSNQQQQHPATLQDRASMALAQTGETMKSLWGAGVSGAQAIGAMAQDKMGGGSGGNGGERSYNNNFLLREDSLECGGHSNMPGIGNPNMNQPPPPVSAAVASGAETSGGGASDQAYSMLKYGKTFCDDLIGFVMQLPPWGKGVVAVILLWVLYVVFG